MYWYELIHRPISIGTQPDDYIEKDETHVNRTGFTFGKVAYDRPLTPKERKDYNLEPVHIPGMIEIGMVNQSFFNDHNIKITVNVFQYLIDHDMIPLTKQGAWSYVDVEFLHTLAIERKVELKNIYKSLRK